MEAVPRRYTPDDLPGLPLCHQAVRAAYRARVHRALALPLHELRIRCGFPSPADDYSHRALDLNDLLVRNPAATHFVEVEGHSMEGAGIDEGDLLCVDRSLDARDGDVVVAVVDGSMTVKTYRTSGRRIWLEAAHPDFGIIRPEAFDVWQVWGVVTGIIKLRRRPMVLAASRDAEGEGGRRGDGEHGRDGHRGDGSRGDGQASRPPELGAAPGRTDG